MNKIIIAAVVVIIAAGGFFIIRNGNDDKQNKNKDSSSATSSNENQGSASGSAGDNRSNNELDPNNYTEGSNIGDTVDATDKAQVSVSIDDFIFKTTYLKIKKGTTVTWTNDGQIGHTVTSAEESPKKGLVSDLLNNGDSYTFTFSETGTYEYFCEPHPTQMRGVVTVVD